MTDYIYSLSLASQTKGFLLSLGFGFLMGAVYDIFRIIRISISKGRKLQILSDIVYCILLAFLTFIFFITVNEGEIRIYLLLGEAIGFAVYGLSMGTIIFAFGKKWIEIIKLFFRFTLKPFKNLYAKVSQILIKRVKTRKKPENKSKMHLKLHKHLLYNLFVKKENLVNKNFNEKDV